MWLLVTQLSTAWHNPSKWSFASCSMQIKYTRPPLETYVDELFEFEEFHTYAHERQHEGPAVNGGIIDCYKKRWCLGSTEDTFMEDLFHAVI
jgi:hypothetical protein